MRVSLVFTIVTCFLQAQGADKYTDENRPYEFGFTIDGEQHRYEKKDSKGIIMGEFGFITADGVYHVTVYATDEEGHFKIISMKNIRVKPYPTAPELKNTPSASSFAPPQQSTTTTTPKPLLRDFTPLPPSRQEKSCSHCSLPAPKLPSIAASKSQQSILPTPSSTLGSNYQLPTGPAQYNPTRQQISSQNQDSFSEPNNFGNVASYNKAYSQQESQKDIGLEPNSNNANANSKLNNPVHVGYNEAEQYPTQGNSPSNFGQNYPKNDYKTIMTGGKINNNPTGANTDQNYPERVSLLHQNSPNTGTSTNQNYPESGTQKDQINSETNRPISQNYSRPETLAGNNYPVQRPSPGENYPAQSQNSQPSSPFSGSLADQNNSGTNGPSSQNYPSAETLAGINYPEQTPITGPNYPAQTINPAPNSSFLDNQGPEKDSSSNPQNSNTNQQQTLRAPGTRERNPKQYGYNQEPVSTAEQPFNSQGSQVPLTSSSSRPVKKPTLISAQMRIVDKNTDVHHRNPGETEGLPNGLNKDDMMRILYTFNYTVGFHGHHEEGFSNGDKVGYYYVTGRNGVRTRVDYVADKNGFRPKVTQEVLNLLSDEVPKPETEKEERFGLKSYEFKWLYFPVESKS